MSEKKSKSFTALLFGSHSYRKGTEWALGALNRRNEPIRIIVAGPTKNIKDPSTIIAPKNTNITIEIFSDRVSDAKVAELF